ncbi:hypothetical protein ANN_10060 [Periplaneta americana]|uniref:Uncharacterized protein n=1 Tax=Periplaneta americana TaxID=6978 RepID=A0ABQ8TN05_PERAM|nr:hypothetical protein ANN_10060 [Periplaneta americana]
MAGLYYMARATSSVFCVPGEYSSVQNKGIPGPFIVTLQRNVCSCVILQERRRLFSFDNLRDYIVVYCNASNSINDDEEEEKKLAGSLVEKKLASEELEGMVNRIRLRGRRRYQLIDDIKIYGSYKAAMAKM